MKVISFEEKYRDDMIYMVLSAKNAIGRVPKLNEDLLDVRKNFFDKGQPFWIALDEFDLKRHGIGSKLLLLAENSAKEHSYKEYKEYYLKKEL